MNDLPVPSTLPALLVAAGALAALSLAEGMRPLRPRREPRWRHAARNVAIFGMAQAIGAPLRLLVVAPLAALVAREGWGLLQATPLPLAVTAFGGVALLDFSLWGWHVMNHRIGVLWRFHAPHHADLDLDATSALRFHAGELALSVLWRCLQVLVLGVGPGLLIAWECLTAVATMFHHSNLGLPARWDRAIARIAPTPRMHGIHHSVRPEERDTNFGVILSAWDALFGTLRLDVPEQSLVLGLSAAPPPGAERLSSVMLLPFRNPPPPRGGA